MLDCSDREVVAGLHTILARGNTDLLAHGFKGYIQMIPDVRSALIRIANGTSVYGISKTGMRPIQVRLPGKDEQIEIAAVLMDMDADLEELAVKKAKSVALKEAMMQQLLTGRIRLV
jgi:type I restriction enzyme S subunit